MPSNVLALHRPVQGLAASALPADTLRALPPSVRAALTVSPFAAEGEAAGVRLNLPLVRIALAGSLSSDDLSAALAVTTEANKPAGPSAALRATTRMRLATRQRAMDEAEERAMLAIYGEKLAAYPADVVAAAAEAWLVSSPFWPAVSEILQACERAMQPRRELILALTLKLRETAHA